MMAVSKVSVVECESASVGFCDTVPVPVPVLLYCTGTYVRRNRRFEFFVTNACSVNATTCGVFVWETGASSHPCHSWREVNL